MYRYRFFLLFCLILAGCWRAPTATPDITAQPTVGATQPGEPPADATLPAATLAASQAPPTAEAPLTQPTVTGRYALDGGQVGASVAAGGGRVWVGTNTGKVLEFDTSGAPLRSYTLRDGATIVNPAPVIALAWDGAHAWALVRFVQNGSQYVTLAVLDPASGETLRQFDVSVDDPRALGLAPQIAGEAAVGQVWLQNAVYDTGTFETVRRAMPTDSSVFAWDGAGMWVGGAATTCDSCQQMLYRYAGGTLSDGPSASQQILALAAAGDRLWVLTGFNQLDGYALGAGLGAATQPAARVDLSADHDFPPAALLYDGSRLWLLGSVGKGAGRLYQHDPASGKKVDGLLVGDDASLPVSMAYDGQYLWVVTTQHLVRVSLPGKP